MTISRCCWRLLITVLSIAPVLAGGKPTLPPTEYEQWYEALTHLRADESKAAIVSNITIVRDVGVFALRRGQFYLCQSVNNRVVAALFVGEGVFSMKPPTDIERKQLYRFYEADSIQQHFTTLFIMFADTTLEELKRKLPFTKLEVTRSVSNQIEYCLRYVSDDDAKYFDTDLMQTFLNNERNGMFYAHFSEEKGKPFFFHINPVEEEEVSFLQRYDRRFTNYRETVTQFHTQEEYRLQKADLDEDKDRIRISDYRIESRITDDLEFSAAATLTLTSLVDRQQWFPFRLFQDLNVDSVYWNSQGPAFFVRSEKNPILWVQTRRPLARNEICSLTVRYSGELLRKDELGWIGLKSSSSWYPRYGYRMRASFDLTFHTPSKWKFVSVGKRLSMTQVGDTIISRWATVRPTSNASFNIGSFKEVVLEDDNLTAERKVGESLPNVSVYEFEFAPKGYGLSDLGEEVRADMLNSMRFFQHVYGKSPVEDFYATEVPFFHGEAFPGLVHLSWATYKYVDRKGSNEIFRAHEVAHQWWGVGVNFKTYHDQWLSEGFSEYSGLWFMQVVLKDNKKFFDALDKMKERILGNRQFLFGSGQEAGPIWLGYRTQSSNTVGDYDLIVYKKGAWVLHMLRNMMIDLKTMNEDRFKNMMHEFYSTYLGKEASTQDFQRMVEKHIGADMSWFFNQWVMDTKIPEYKFAYKTEKTSEGKFKVTCRVRQENVPQEFKMAVPLLVKFDDDKFVRLRIFVSGDKLDYDLPLLPLEPKEIVFNDLSSVLCEVDNVKWK